MELRKALLAIIVLMAGLVVGVAAEATGKILAYGIFQTTEKASSSIYARDPKSPSGNVRMIISGYADLVKETSDIPLKPGLVFGLYYEISDPDLKDGTGVEYTVVRTDPSTKASDGKPYRYSLMKAATAYGGKWEGFTFFSFETVEQTDVGRYTFEVQFRGKTLLSKEFMTYLPAPVTVHPGESKSIRELLDSGKSSQRR